MHRRSPRPTPEPGPVCDSMRWLTTFNDMITLLMVFFVLLFSMGSMDTGRFRNFRNGLQSALGVLYEGRHAPVGIIAAPDAKDSLVAAPAPEGADDDGLDALMNTPGLEAEYTPRGIQLILDDRLLFDSGSADLTPAGRSLLHKVAKVIRPLDRYIRVEGHTDNVPIATRRYPSNWDLSTARAVRVVKYMVLRGGIAPQHLAAAGYGASRPRAANDTAENRLKNRRVEIILGTKVESQSGAVENIDQWRN